IALFTFALGAIQGFHPVDATVGFFQKISDTQGNFTAPLDDDDRFGISIAPLGDLDGDGVDDIAVGAYLDQFYGARNGAVYVLLLNADGTVKSHVKIGAGQSGFTGDLSFWDEFGISVTAIGDLDDDGVVDIAVGARLDDDSVLGADMGADVGAVWILFLNTTGTVKAHQKISAHHGGFGSGLDDADWFGSKGAALGDVDGDGVEDLAVSATQDDDGGTNRGAVWVLHLNTNGTVKSKQKISSTQGGFAGALDDGDFFGAGLASIGDFDGDGVLDLAVGATFDDDGGTDHGAVWILFRNLDGTVKAHQKISDTEGGFTGVLEYDDRFGVVELLGTDCTGATMLAVGAALDDDGGTDHGAVWLLRLNGDGTVASHSKISDTEGGFAGDLDYGDLFGLGVASLGDFDGDGAADLAVGARLDDDGGDNRGAVYLLFLESCLVQPASIDFGTITVGQFADASFTVKNEGCDPISGEVSESCDAFSIISGGGPFALGSGDSIVVSVRFAPTTPDAFDCFVQTGNSGCGDVSLTGIGQLAPVDPNPDVLSILDVGNDQGRNVRIGFARSGRDVLNSPTPILQYEIFRRIDELPSATSGAATAEKRRGEMVSDRGVLLEGWEYVGSLPAHGETIYNVIAPTLADATNRFGMHWSVFFVRAATAQPLVFFDSPPDSGYSEDNNPPGPPSDLVVAYDPALGNELDWTAPSDVDVYEYRVYRNDQPGFEPSGETLVHVTPATDWFDAIEMPSQYYYLVAAVDLAGNEGPAVEPNVTTGIGDGVPGQTALHQNVPNPFNPSTTIAYDVAAPGGRVTLHVFDVRGQLIRTLVDTQQGPGSRSVHWDGRDDRGQRVVSGMYFYRLRVGDVIHTRKMTIVQ
ncbi:MAG: FG-GAP-like repeat-containing protein, partial [Candidatus Latescibacteria bacterium]|nr:FG-GAP-like repeat-containing protein [Candidatus Latescibacterota bacterium]